MTIVGRSEVRPSTAHIVIADEVVHTRVAEEPLLEDKEWMAITKDGGEQAAEEIGPFAEIFQIMLNESTASLAQASGEESMDDEPSEETSEDGSDPLTVHTGTTSADALVQEGNDSFEAAADADLDDLEWELAVASNGLPERFTGEMATPDGEPVTAELTYSAWGEPR